MKVIKRLIAFLLLPLVCIVGLIRLIATGDEDKMVEQIDRLLNWGFPK